MASQYSKHQNLDLMPSDEDNEIFSDNIFAIRNRTTNRSFTFQQQNSAHDRDSLESFTSDEDDDDFNSDELFNSFNKEVKTSTQQENNNSHELSIKISKEDHHSSYQKSLGENDLAELLIKGNKLITLNNILHYWSETKKHYIPLVGEAADKFIRLRTPTPYKRKINHKSIGEILQWIKTNDDLNVDQYIENGHRFIAFQNGVYDTYLSELLPHSPDYFLVNIIQAEYPNNNFLVNNGEHFEQFLDDITEGDSDLYDRLQELFGYVLSDIREVKYLPFLVGVKDTGKSIVLKLLEYLVGENSYTNLNFEQLNNPVFLAELIGKKLNTCGELGEFKLNRLDIFKKLSGGDSILAKPLYEKPIKFKNTAALIFAGNHLPAIKGLDKANAFSDRLVIFPFTNPIPKEQQDIHLFDKLIAETGYIVKWAMDGLNRWIDNNYQFTVCEKIIELTQKYAEQSNSIENFIKDCCEYNAEYKTYRNELEEAYYYYCNEKGLTPESIKLLHDQLKLDIRLNHKRFRKDGENKFGYLGIGIRALGGINYDYD
ncbi:phage/plasmid primase, P4 family [Rummeliibacillus stabekisii]|uniref:DNA primase family protein n=1 Tax=Rummeliibacillus stabekisii TaxID=241244 RepID=UPI00203B1A9F|nr:phage/plasmid primase, P4 family [Rummeliibacillus stabekisii]MCM3317193.1 phage/plasmid primase, P4 family [Rummeliibacillus stabekisii]